MSTTFDAHTHKGQVTGAKNNCHYIQRLGIVVAGKIDIILFSKSLVLDSEATTEGWMWKLRRCRLDLSADQKMIPSRKVFDRTGGNETMARWRYRKLFLHHHRNHGFVRDARLSHQGGQDHLIVELNQYQRWEIYKKLRRVLHLTFGIGLGTKEAAKTNA